MTNHAVIPSLAGELPLLRAVVGYLRVSTKNQAVEGESLPAQRARLEAWAAANGYHLVSVYVDEGLSAATMIHRPGVQAAVADACKRRCPVVVVALSRLVRSVADAIAVSERLSRSGADLISLSEHLDSSTASGRLVFKLLAVLGEFERELISERTKSTMDHLRQQGRRIGGVPFGWSVAADGTTLVPIPEEQATLAVMRDLRAQGHSFREIAAELTARGIPTKLGRTSWLGKTVNAVVSRDAERTARSKPQRTAA